MFGLFEALVFSLHCQVPQLKEQQKYELVNDRFPCDSGLLTESDITALTSLLKNRVVQHLRPSGILSKGKRRRESFTASENKRPVLWWHGWMATGPKCSPQRVAAADNRQNLPISSRGARREAFSDRCFAYLIMLRAGFRKPTTSEFKLPCTACNFQNATLTKCMS